MGGVLIDYNPKKTLYGLFDKETADIALREIFRNSLWADKDRGIIEPEDIMRAVGDKIPPEAYEKVKEMTYNLYPYMTPYKDTEELVKKLKRNGYRIFLLSNASLDFYTEKKNIPALDIFDGYLISADYHLLKPEKEIYEKLYTKFNLDPGECIFIDDVAANCEGSEKAGMKAFCNVERDINLMIKGLEEAGVTV